MLPDPPKVSEDDLEKCRATGDYSPVMFEWYKFVGGLCETFSNLLSDSPLVRSDISNINYGILAGLLCRCARLVLANVALSHEGKFGESTSILDRSIFESSITLSWLCRSNLKDKFERYIADGLRAELELQSQIQARIQSRRGAELNIETRMKASMEQCLSEAGFTEDSVSATKRLPNMAAMLEAIGHERISYTVGQRIGSHHVHGTWVGLRQHYISLTDEGRYEMKSTTEMHVNQYIYISSVLLDALSDFVEYVFVEGVEEKQVVLKLFHDTAEEIGKLNFEIVGSDFEYGKDPCKGQ